MSEQTHLVIAKAISDLGNITLYTAEDIGSILYPRTAAEIAAGVTPTAYQYAPGIFERYGATGDGTTVDYTAINNALLQSNQTGGSPAKAGGRKTYNIGANTLAIPNNGALDISSASIVSTNVAAITFGTNSTLFGYDKATIVSAGGAAGAALKMASTASPAAWYIFGWPALSPTTAGTAGGIGLDFTGAYKGIFELSVSGYETNISGGTASITPQTYYNELRSPHIVGTSGLTGIQLLNGCNATLISNPQINGQNVLTKGIYINQAASIMLNGGYLEGFLANAATRGLLLTDTDNVTVVGTTFDQGTDATANFAIGVTGTSTQVNLYGCGFAGAWGNSGRIMSWTSSGIYNLIGGVPTNQVCLLGLSSFAGSYTNGFTSIGNLTAGGITASVAAAAATAHTLANSGDGIGTELSNNSATITAARSVLVINRKGGVGTDIAVQNNGSAAYLEAHGTGSPEGVLTATVSSVYHRTDGGVSTSLYVKETGSGNTGWVAK